MVHDVGYPHYERAIIRSHFVADKTGADRRSVNVGSMCSDALKQHSLYFTSCSGTRRTIPSDVDHGRLKYSAELSDGVVRAICRSFDAENTDTPLKQRD